MTSAAWCQQTLFFAGKVVMADGTPTPRNIPIETVCSTISRVEGNTDEKGGFYFQAGKNQFQGNGDASVSVTNGSQTFGGPSLGRVAAPGASNTTYMGCHLRAKLEGHISTSLELSRLHPGDSPDLGTIILKRASGNEGVTVSATAMMAPKEAQKAFENGVQNAQRLKYADAEKDFTEAVRLYPRYANAHFELGMTQEALKKEDAAIIAYKDAIGADDKLERPYLRLAFIALKRGNWKETADWSDTLLRLNPIGYAEGYYYNAVAHINLEHPEKAFDSAEQAVKLDRGHKIPDAERLYGLLLAGSGQLKEAAEQLKNYIEHAPPSAMVTNAKGILAQIEKQLTSR